ncbi:hypothetical protein HQO38_18670 [Rhodococcus fascians]|nr:hypothetical protein [Rhodococcus fascians]MBY4140965.1 hypothetical protein [Rhodococcus fascians]MBY4219629.1 hypothetical protein [Rhodococcus fascians]MBY4221938.1 hypothetical protein [Rhodococcus fascians]MBY4233939.1 hypothetical protein [Rhodococcus fascians]
MMIELEFPQLGAMMQEGILASWPTLDGTEASHGDALYPWETDNAENDSALPACGTPVSRAEAGRTYPVGIVLSDFETVE